jgi:shikimate dehydrogenase
VRDDGFRGVNITHPFKAEVVEQVDHPGMVPEKLGPFNTLIFRENGVHDENTDCTGFIMAYSMRFGSAKPEEVLLLGRGGVGKSLAFGMGALGATMIYLFEKDHVVGEDLEQRLLNSGYPCKLIAEDQLVDTAKAVDGILNATIYQYPGNPLPTGAAAINRWAFEAIYTPLETEFVHMMKKVGAEILTGYELFLNQGVDAFEHFTGVKLDRQATIAHYLAKGHGQK